MQRLKRIFFSLIFRIFPVKKRKIVISSYYGKGYNDNLKYITNELVKNENLEIIWPISDDIYKGNIPEGIKICKYDGIKYLYHLSTARVWIDNCRKAFYYKKKKQLYIQTWHGGGGQKRIEKDVIDKLGPYYERGAVRDSKQIDLMISESKFLTDLYHRAFWYNGPVWECGYPRYDILYKNHGDIVNKVYDYYNISKSKMIVLYAPTFRKDKSIDVYDLDFERTRKAISDRFNKDVVFLIRLHPIMTEKDVNIHFNLTRTINASNYADAQELLCASSILIGDYSSINFDFALMRKPVFRYTRDINTYKEDRDFYYPFETFPYPYAENNDEFITLIKNFDYNEYNDKLNIFFALLGVKSNINSSQLISDFIVNYINSGMKSKKYIEKNSNLFVYKNI